MPQMSPMDWLILYIYLLLIYFLVLMLIYFLIIFKFMDNLKFNNNKQNSFKFYW